MPSWSDIIAQAASYFGHIIRKVGASGTEEQPNRPYLDFSGNCTVEDTGESIKVTVPDVPAGQVSVGETETLPAGSSAAVTQRGTAENRVLDFGIPTGPQGPQGEQGEAATIRVGTVESAEPGEQVRILNVGTETDAIFNFKLPKGDRGPKGELYVTKTKTLGPGHAAYVKNLGSPDTAYLEFGIPRGKAATIYVNSVTTLDPAADPYIKNSGSNRVAVLDFGLPTATKITVGTTTTLGVGESATVTPTGTTRNTVLNFGLPKGDPCTVAVGEVETLSPGTNAYVTNVGTASDAVFNFGIPAGNPLAENVPIAGGGTGATTAQGARTNLDVPSNGEMSTAITTAITNLRNALYVPVQALPQEGEAGKVYLLANSSSETGNLYDEYIYTNGAWEKLGPRTIDLSGYSLKTETLSSISASGTTVTYTKADGTTGSFATQDTTYEPVTTTANGLMTAGDKAKLDGITDSADAVSFTQSLASGTQVGTITINGTPYNLYCQTNTDVNVTQAISSTAGEYPILAKSSTATATITGTTIFDADVTINPAYGLIKATNMTGVSAAAGTTIYPRTGCVQTRTISANTTFTFNYSNLSGTCCCFTLILTNGGNYTVTWPSTVKWADDSPPDLTSSGVDVITFLTNDSGSTWYGVPSIINAA